MTEVFVPSAYEVGQRLNLNLTNVLSEGAAIYRAEVEAQARACRTEPYNEALSQALIRRVARAMAMKNLPLGILSDEMGSTRIGSNDPEVRRLEGPYRKVPLG